MATDQKEYMRNYMRARRAAGRDRSRAATKRSRNADSINPALPPSNIAREKLTAMLAGYARSPTALEHSAHLDALVRSRFAALLSN
jgi:hypothetical protein